MKDVYPARPILDGQDRWDPRDQGFAGSPDPVNAGKKMISDRLVDLTSALGRGGGPEIRRGGVYDEGFGFYRGDARARTDMDVDGYEEGSNAASDVAGNYYYSWHLRINDIDTNPANGAVAYEMRMYPTRGNMCVADPIVYPVRPNGNVWMHDETPAVNLNSPHIPSMTAAAQAVFDNPATGEDVLQIIRGLSNDNSLCTGGYISPYDLQQRRDEGRRFYNLALQFLASTRRGTDEKTFERILEDVGERGEQKKFLDALVRACLNPDVDVDDDVRAVARRVEDKKDKMELLNAIIREEYWFDSDRKGMRNVFWRRRVGDRGFERPSAWEDRAAGLVGHWEKIPDMFRESPVTATVTTVGLVGGSILLGIYAPLVLAGVLIVGGGAMVVGGVAGVVGNEVWGKEGRDRFGRDTDKRDSGAWVGAGIDGLLMLAGGVATGWKALNLQMDGVVGDAFAAMGGNEAAPTVAPAPALGAATRSAAAPAPAATPPAPKPKPGLVSRALDGLGRVVESKIDRAARRAAAAAKSRSPNQRFRPVPGGVGSPRVYFLRRSGQYGLAFRPAARRLLGRRRPIEVAIARMGADGRLEVGPWVDEGMNFRIPDGAELYRPPVPGAATAQGTAAEADAAAPAAVQDAAPAAGGGTAPEAPPAAPAPAAPPAAEPGPAPGTVRAEPFDGSEGGVEIPARALEAEPLSGPRTQFFSRTGEEGGGAVAGTIDDGAPPVATPAAPRSTTTPRPPRSAPRRAGTPPVPAAPAPGAATAPASAAPAPVPPATPSAASRVIPVPGIRGSSTARNMRVMWDGEEVDIAVIKVGDVLKAVVQRSEGQYGTAPLQRASDDKFTLTLPDGYTPVRITE